MRTLLHLVPLLPIVIGGCFGGEALNLEGFMPVAPTSLAIPEWEVGKTWTYRSTEGHYQNWTVAATELVAGRQAYRVIFTDSRPDSFSAPDVVQWFDKESLGLVRFETGLVQAWSECPMNQIFPVENRTYSCMLHTNTHGSRKLDFQLAVLGWRQVSPPIATTYGLEIRSQDLDPDFAFVVHGWYNPLAEFYVQYEEDGLTYHLVSIVEG